MRRGMLAIVVACLVVAAGCGSAAAPPAGIAGDWHGTIDAGAQGKLDFGAHLAGDGTGTVDIPAQNATGLKVTGAALRAGTVTFALPDVPGGGSFSGTLAGDTVTGTFTQGGKGTPFTMARGPLPAPARPQEPEPPYPYRSSAVSFPSPDSRSGAVTLAGTLTEPDGPGPFPGVVMITGSGAQDRDETIAGHKPFLVIADTLTKAGFAVLRTDDRGVGGSGGDLNAATYDDLVGDALAGVAFLRSRGEVDQARLGLFGHSEGGYLAPLAADRSNGQVHVVVMMAGPAVSGLDVLVDQNRALFQAQGAPAAEVDKQVTFLRQLARLLAAGQTGPAQDLVRARIAEATASLPAAQRPSPGAVDAQVTAQTSANFAAFTGYDPTAALTALAVPTLAFYGSKDVQVAAALNQPALEKALAGKPGVTITTLPGLNHLMQPAQTGQVTEYATIEQTVDPSALDLVSTWLKQKFE